MPDREPITAEQVYEILDGPVPRRDLSRRSLPGGIDLRGANIDGVSFQDSILRNADLSGARLHEVNFQAADLTGARFTKARCSDTQFTDAVLRGADFTDCEDLNTAQLAGADLTGAKLPEAIADFEILKTVKDAADQTKTLFISMIAACAYVWLTVGSTRDLALLSNSLPRRCR